MNYSLCIFLGGDLTVTLCRTFSALGRIFHWWRLLVAVRPVGRVVLAACVRKADLQACSGMLMPTASSKEQNGTKPSKEWHLSIDQTLLGWGADACAFGGGAWRPMAGMMLGSARAQVCFSCFSTWLKHRKKWKVRAIPNSQPFTCSVHKYHQEQKERLGKSVHQCPPIAEGASGRFTLFNKAFGQVPPDSGYF